MDRRTTAHDEVPFRDLAFLHASMAPHASARPAGDATQHWGSLLKWYWTEGPSPSQLTLHPSWEDALGSAVRSGVRVGGGDGRLPQP